MMHRQQSTKLKPHRQKALKDAYDLKAALSECRRLGCQSKAAFAYMSEGRVRLVFSPSTQEVPDNGMDERSLYRQWLSESDFADFLLRRADSSKPSQTTPPRMVRCVACSYGGTWEVWEEIEVCRILCNPGMCRGKGWAFIPIEDTVCDPDRREGVWYAPGKTPVADRSMAFAQSVLHEAVRLFLQASQLVPGFRAAYESLDIDDEWKRATPIARLIRDSKRAALRQMEACLSLALPDGPRQQDEAIASRQGFLMGRWLAQAEAIIASERAAKLAAVVGAGKPRSKLWAWINSDARFTGKSAKEVWLLLNGHEDPDHPGKKLMLKDNRLQRGNGEWLKITSFTASFKKH